MEICFVKCAVSEDADHHFASSWNIDESNLPIQHAVTDLSLRTNVQGNMDLQWCL